MDLSLEQIVSYLNNCFPIHYQESWDNSGLLVDTDKPIKKVLTCLDCTPEVVSEAIENQVNLIVTHHPLIFKGLKKIVSTDKISAMIKVLIKNDIALYCAHTNLDNAKGGLNDYLADTLGLSNIEVLEPLKKQLYKIVTYVPEAHAQNVRKALFEAGAGHIGNYDLCSFNITGQGTFRGGDNSNPFVGKVGKEHTEVETRIETVVEQRNLQRVIDRMIEAHPYEEVAYDIYQTENDIPKVGLGRVGTLPCPMNEVEFVKYVKERLSLRNVMCSTIDNRTIKRVAVIGGSGSATIETAIIKRADAIITGDIKHHTYIDCQSRIFLVDIGHHESEKMVMQIFSDYLTKKNPNFAVLKSKTNFNPINFM